MNYDGSRPMNSFAIGVGKTLLASVLGLAAQQLVAAGVYGVLAYPVGTELRVSWFDYVEEYVLWRLRAPTQALTTTEVVANALGLVTVVVVSVILYKGVL